MPPCLPASSVETPVDGRIASDSAALPAFTVLTLNTHKGFSGLRRRHVLPELRDAVRQTAADLVFLQEVLGAYEYRQRGGGRQNVGPQYEFLAEQIWPAYVYGRNAVYPQGHHGNALLAKYPILHHENHDISEQGHEKRGLLHCVLQPPAWPVPLHAICVHLGLREAQRRRQLELLCELVSLRVPAGLPLVVAGDFNDWRGQAHARLQRCGLREVFVETEGLAARSFPALWPLLRLDRIYLRELRPRVLQVLRHGPWSHLSDHVALLAELSP